MIIKQLAVENFRVFAGRHEFDLSPRMKYNDEAPIVLFGGLNGAGKTSILTAVLILLYGRQSLGAGTSQRAYERFLAESIHKSNSLLIPPNASQLQMTFTFANMGIVSDYQVNRSWMVDGSRVVEELTILRSGKKLADLNFNQAEAFLNELIPIGVSDLFFFDGERIKALAEDKTGKHLADAIRKLLGLDLIQRLNADLTLLIRDKEKHAADAEIKALIEAKEKELNSVEQFAEEQLTEYEQTHCRYVEVRSEIDRVNSELQAAGGAWSTSRQDVLKNHATTEEVKRASEAKLRELLAGSYPYALMPTFSAKVTERLKQEENHYRERLVAEAIRTRREEFLASIDSLPKKHLQLVSRHLKEVFATPEQDSIHARHDLTPMQIARTIDAIESSQVAQVEIRKHLRALKKHKAKLDETGVELSRAPDERVLRERFEHLRALTQELGELQASLKSIASERKKALYKAIEVARKLRNLHDELNKHQASSRSLALSKATKSMLAEFSDKTTQARVLQLETEFAQSFGRLARKDDARFQARIDPETFDVHLTDPTGRELNKNELSAGEKQIYAIAILEALAKTSGRNLPIIIDTPLGRLDSKHREKLCENYFPYASQQVIILSTDTEVDESFYAQLQKSISHSYQLIYDPTSQATTAEKGYFWRNKKDAA